MTERDMQRDLMPETKRILSNPGGYSLPGWESVEKALAFLQSEAAKGPVRGETLGEFFRAAGV